MGTGANSFAGPAGEARAVSKLETETINQYNIVYDSTI